MLKPDFTPAFERDVKRLRHKHVDMAPMQEIVRLILADDLTSKNELKRRHRMHVLSGDWSGTIECHIDNRGDWLLVWERDGMMAVFLRMGTHDELFGS